MTRPGIEPRSPGPLANTLTAGPMSLLTLLYLLLEKYTSHFIERVVCERELEAEQNCNILTPHRYGHNHVSFPFSWAAQLGAWGPTLLGAGFLYRILSPTDWTSCAPSYIIVRRSPSHMGVTNRTHSARPRSRLYSDIPRPDAPVIYTGAFPILTARPSWRSIYNIGNFNSRDGQSHYTWPIVLGKFETWKDETNNNLLLFIRTPADPYLPLLEIQAKTRIPGFTQDLNTRASSTIWSCNCRICQNLWTQELLEEPTAELTMLWSIPLAKYKRSREWRKEMPIRKLATNTIRINSLGWPAGFAKR